eukprot:gene16718-biopygen14345
MARWTMHRNVWRKDDRLGPAPKASGPAPWLGSTAQQRRGAEEMGQPRGLYLVAGVVCTWLPAGLHLVAAVRKQAAPGVRLANSHILGPDSMVSE